MMQPRILQQGWQVIKFTGISLLWFALSAGLMTLALKGLDNVHSTLFATLTWYGFLIQVSLFWLSLVIGGIGLAHITLTRHWYRSLRHIAVLWRGLMQQQWDLLGFILVLSYAAVAFMVYVVQKNAGLDGQVLLAVTAAALVMFSREVSQKALYLVAYSHLK